jgi:hypothetical protein
MKRLALLLISIFVCLTTQAQVNTLRFVPNSFQVRNLNTGLSSSDTLFTSYGDSIEIQAQVVFTGPSSIVDEIGFGIVQDSLMAQGADSLFLGIAPADTILNNDTLTVTITDQLDSMLARYSGGTGGGAIVVVVWPVLRSGISTTENGATIIFNFAERTAIEDPEFERLNRVICFPNPTQNSLYFRQKESISNFEYVRIQGLLGRELFKSTVLPKSIEIGHWPKGLYLIEIRYGDGQQEVWKIEKQ